jgi:uncharacterized membrane protein
MPIVKWIRHAARMENDVSCRKITVSQQQGSRKKGRYALIWLHSRLKRHENFEVTDCLNTEDSDL